MFGTIDNISIQAKTDCSGLDRNTQRPCPCI